MNLSRRTGLYVLLSLIAGILLAGCSVSMIAIGRPDESPRKSLIFSEDFSDIELGGVPSGWSSIRSDVIEVEGINSGKALRVYSEGTHDEKSSIRSPLWRLEGEDPEKILIDIKVRQIEGVGDIMFRNESNKDVIFINLYSRGNLRYFDDSSYIELDAGMHDGWNHIRIIADRHDDEAFVFVNNMETPLGGPFSLRMRPDTWDKIRLYISHNGKTENEIHYADIEVWAIYEN